MLHFQPFFYTFSPPVAEYTHGRLKKYYSRMFGFVAVREVGEGGLRDLPHMLVWGGAGTRMNGNLEEMLTKCSRAYRRD